MKHFFIVVATTGIIHNLKSCVWLQRGPVRTILSRDEPSEKDPPSSKLHPSGSSPPASSRRSSNPLRALFFSLTSSHHLRHSARLWAFFALSSFLLQAPASSLSSSSSSPLPPLPSLASSSSSLPSSVAC